jgi:FAD dependent oxidoreductase TIGR03364
MASGLSQPSRGPAFDDRADGYDLVVVGAGIVGLGHAYDAVIRGLRVAVVERATTIAGSSVRNFGHIGVTAQAGEALEYAEEARARWRTLAKRADIWLRDAGAIVVAADHDELDVLAEFQSERGTGTAVLLHPDKVAECSPVPASSVLGGAWLSRDLQVDPRTAAPRIADWLAECGVQFFWRTTALAVESGTVHTSRGVIRAETIVVAVNVDVDGLYPGLAVQRCSLEMLSATADLRADLAMPVLTGWSMIRYSGFAHLESTSVVRERLHREHPTLAALDVNHMVTQRPNGDLIIGDTHTVADTVSPFQAEVAFDELLEATRRLFGTDQLRVRERWQGVYAKGDGDFLVESPADGVRVVAVTTGIGMTTGLGLAASVMKDLYDSTSKGHPA